MIANCQIEEHQITLRATGRRAEALRYVIQRLSIGNRQSEIVNEHYFNLASSAAPTSFAGPWNMALNISL